MKNGIYIGIIKIVNEEAGFALLRGSGLRLEFTAACGVAQGTNGPVFVNTSEFSLPQKGTHVVCVVVNAKVAAWSSYSRYKATGAALVSAHPVYRAIAHRHRFAGKFTGAAEEVIIEAPMEVTQTLYPRRPAGQNDRCGTYVAAALGTSFQSETRWEVRKADGTWVKCSDPRPTPVIVRSAETAVA